MTTQDVPAGRDTSRRSALPLPEPVLTHRIDYWTWVDLHATDPARGALLALRDHWRAVNADYFGGAMTEPYITLTEPSAPAIYGQCCPVSSWGSRLEIRIRPSLLAGTHPHMVPGNDHHPGRLRFVTDVVTHEAIHQWQIEITGATEASYHGHGKTFAAKCNAIGSILGLPPVKVRNRNGSRDLVCAHWPHNVRPPEHYLGAYLGPVPDSRDICSYCRGTGREPTPEDQKGTAQ